MQRTILKKNNDGISFIINAHNEGGIFISALRSVLLAKKECEKNDIETEIIVIVDKPNSVTSNIVKNWKSDIDILEFISVGNLGIARTHAIKLATKDFFCFLDADDIWQKEWPLKAYQFAKNNNFKHTVFHTELFVSFGDHYEVRKQIQSTDSLFHPAHLGISWHFCNNLFAHRSIFERIPLTPYDHSKGFGSEDWHWSCETLAAGIGRLYVPETVYFYRIDNTKQSLGKKRNLILKKSKLFSQSTETETYPLDCNKRSQSDFLLNGYSLKKSQKNPLWLNDVVKNSVDLDFNLFPLYDVLQTYQTETQTLYPISSSLFSKIRFLYDTHGQFSVVLVSENCLTLEEKSRLHFSLNSQNLSSTPKFILCDGDLINQMPYKFFGSSLVVNISIFWKESGGNKYTLNQVLGLMLSNFTPSYIFNYNHWYGETISEDYRVFLRYHNISFVSYFEKSLLDVNNIFGRRVLSKTLTGENAINIIIVNESENIPYTTYLNRFQYTTVRSVYESLDIGELNATTETVSKIVNNENRNFLFANNSLIKDRQIDKQYSVSVIMNIHREGVLLNATLNSLERMLSYSTEFNLKLELLLVLDDSDDQTKEIISKFVQYADVDISMVIIDVTHKNLSLARNSGASAASGDFLCFLDADDLYSKNWLINAYKIAKKHGNKTIVHPEVNIYFGADKRVFRHYNSKDINLVGLLFENYWTSLSFASREIYLNHPYELIDLDNGFGYEDWHWNMEVLSSGCEHVIAPKTAHFIRLKNEGSLNQASAQRNVLNKPTALYKKLLFS
jgi:glycosyltransferase involved in cell wall biosynthesis